MQQTEALPRITGSTSAWTDRKFWAVLWAKNDPGGDRDMLGSKRLLDVVLVLGEHLLDVMVKMELDRLVVLFDLHTQERLHAAASSDAEILGILPQQLVLELDTDCCVHHVAHEQAVDNECSPSRFMKIVFSLLTAG